MAEMNSTVILLDTDTSYATRLSDSLRDAGLDTCISRSVCEAVDYARELPLSFCLADVEPEQHLSLLRQMRSSGNDTATIFTAADTDVEQAVRVMRAGAADYLAKPRDPTGLVTKALSYARSLNQATEVVSVSTLSQHSFHLARRVANTDVSVLINGESGTGKEVIASYLHARSARCDGPFVALNCAAIPEQMLEAMLFGHEKGAFTGAHQRRPGKFELAHNGSILLDEVSEMPLPLQAKLLRVLQEREIEPVGAKYPKPVDVRVIATTNRNLQACVRDGQFREDLFYRLNVFPLTLAPLRERTEDILPLAEHFIHKYSRRLAPTGFEFSQDAKTALLGYHWPGNVRELENVIQRGLVMMEGDALLPEHLNLVAADCSRSVGVVSGQLDECLREEEIQLVANALRKNGGNRRATASSLGVSERTLRHKLQKWREQGKDISRLK